MEWLRWHHGCVTDEKWPLIARRSGQKVAAVLAVWAALLERASQAAPRGSMEGFDCESFDVVLGLEDGACAAILAAMEDKGVIVGGSVAKWKKRQPEKEDGTATERKRRQRERAETAAREAHAEREGTAPSLETKEVTPGHAVSRGGHGLPREVTPEEIREEKREESLEGRTYARARVAYSVPEIHPDRLPGINREPSGDMPHQAGPKRTDCPSRGTPEWPAFLSCWEVYPVRQGQEDAWREWSRLKRNGTLAQAWEIRDAILRLSGEDSRWLRGKVPKMAKWLAGKGWDDEPYVEPSPPGPAARQGPAAYTVHQADRKHMAALASAVLQADEVLHNGVTAENQDRAGQAVHALPASPGS